MHFGFALELSDIDLWNTDLLDTHLGLLNPEISIQISPVSILFVSIKSLRGLQDMSSRRLQDMSSRRLQDMSSRRLQDMSSRRLQDVFSVTIFRLPRHLQDVFKTSSKRLCKTSSRRLGRRKIVALKTCWRRLQDMCLQGQQMFAGEGIFRRTFLKKIISIVSIHLIQGDVLDK